MKRNGFTLTELLGVIVILSLLMIIVFPSIVNSVKKSSNKIDDLTLELLSNAADLHISNNTNDFIKKKGNKYSISLQELIDEGHLVSPILTADGTDITNNKCIQVTYNNGYNYELKDIGNCDEKVLICELVEKNGTEEYNPGDRYSCEVKSGVKYDFFILSLNKDQNENIESINLIMDGFLASDGTQIKSNEDITRLKNENVEYESAWISTEDYSGEICDPNLEEVKTAAQAENLAVVNYCAKYYANTDKGPITVLKYLQNATSSWEYIANMEYDYTDEGLNYGKIKTEGSKTLLKDKSGNTIKTFNNFKVRLPKYSEINDYLAEGYELSSVHEEGKKDFMTKLPTWITNYIADYSSSEYKTYDECISFGDDVVCSLSGFWLLSSVDSNIDSTQRLVYDVSTEGFLGKSNTVTSSKYYVDVYSGVRPVITLNKNSLYTK